LGRIRAAVHGAPAAFEHLRRRGADTILAPMLHRLLRLPRRPGVPGTSLTALLRTALLVASAAFPLIVLSLYPVAATNTAAAQDNLPSLGRTNTVLSELDEKRLGRDFILKARRSMNFIDDPELTQYITDLGRRIAGASDEPGSEFRFYVIRNNALNAFAVPGGHIAVNTGLIMATRTEAELASVVAHEVAHVTQHHLARMVEGQKHQGLKMLGALAAAILLGGEAGQAAVVAANASAIENRLEYSRSFEQEADAIGIQTLARAGYDPRGMPSFFERLLRWARVYDTGAPEFLRTHPLTTDRIADSKVRADGYPHIDNPDHSDFYHVRAKIRATLSDNAVTAAERFAANLESGDYEHEGAERYGYALALSEAGRHDQAVEAIDRLVEHNPDSIRHQTARANILMEAGRYEQALEHFRRIHERWPDHRALGLYYSSALIQTKHFDEAKTVLKKLLLKAKDDPRIYSLLARAEGEMGNSLVAHQNLAEYYYLRANLSEAFRHLKLAEKYAGDSDYAKASIEARLEDIKREMEIYALDPTG